ncbi:MAG: YfhO family protein [Rikenellaceae bacterium]
MEKIKNYLPHIAAFLLFIAISVAYFAPQYSGMDVRKGDDIQYQGMKGGITEYVEEHGEHPQWAPNMFSGMPAYLIDMDYDGRYIKNIADQFYFLGKPAAYYFILMAGFYFMLLCFGVNPYLALVGSVGYGLSTYFLIIYEAGHITKLMALAYIAPLIGAVFLAYRKNLLLGASLAGIFAAIEISASHPQITYYFFYVLFALAIFEGVNSYKEGKIKRFITRSVVLAAVGALSLGANSIQLWYVNDYAKDSIRGKSELTISDNSHNHTSGLDKDYITAWSYGKAESFNMLIPNFVGGSSMGGFSKDGVVAESLKPYNASSMATQLPAYWGPQPFTSGAVYIGAVIVFLAVLAMFVLRGWIKWWLVSVSLLALFLAWGKNMMWLTDIFIDYVPLYNKFRTVSMILVIIEWSFPLLGMLALQKVFSGEVSKEDSIKALKKSVYVVGGILLFFIVLGGTIMSFTSPSDSQLPAEVAAAMSVERAELLRADAIRSLLFVLLTAAVIWLFLKDKLKEKIAIVSLLLFVLVDMVGVGLRHLNYDDFVPKKSSVEIKPTAADLEILKDTDLSYRVANLSVSPFNDANTSYFHKSIGGYHAAKMRRYQDMIDRYLSKMDMEVYSMLNTKYFIVADKESGAPTVQLNPDAFGNGWFVENIKFVDGADSEIAEIANVDLRTTAVVDNKFKYFVENLAFEADSTSSIVLVESEANRQKYEVESGSDRAVVLSEIYYPKGWTLYIDGVETPYFRANYILRGFVVPAGKHTVEFKFEAPNFGVMKAVTIACSMIILLMFVLSIVKIILNRKNEEK